MYGNKSFKRMLNSYTPDKHITNETNTNSTDIVGERAKRSESFKAHSNSSQIDRLTADYTFAALQKGKTTENVHENVRFPYRIFATGRVLASIPKMFHSNRNSFEVPSTSANTQFSRQIARSSDLKKCSGLFLNYLCYIISLLLQRSTCHLLLIIFVCVSRIDQCNTLLITKPSGLTNVSSYRRLDSLKYDNNGTAGTGGYLDKLNLERRVEAVKLKVAYGTTLTTKRSIPDGNYIPGLTTIPTPILTTTRYMETPSQQQYVNVHHRNYELDLERDHALPTSAPNADILKSNSNPTYPNPNRHHNHDREHHRSMLNSTPMPSLPNVMKKHNGQIPTIPMYPLDVPSYSPPARSFFTPPLPPEYQNPFADKPTLRGTNNEGIVAHTGTYINRRPIPPPSLMPGHERIPFRPPDLAASTGGGNGAKNSAGNSLLTNPIVGPNTMPDIDRKNVLNTPSHGNDSYSSNNESKKGDELNRNYNPVQDSKSVQKNMHKTRKEPGIRRILSGEIPEVLLKQATTRPATFYHAPPSSPIVLVDNASQIISNDPNGITSSSNINISIKSEKGNNNITTPINSEEIKSTEIKSYTNVSIEQSGGGSGHNISSTPSAAAAIGEASAGTSTTSTISTLHSNMPTLPSLSSSSSATSATSPSVEQSNWAIAWNIHVYLSVILFTILAVYSLYKLLTYNKLTHLFSQSYFVCINITLLIICTSRIFYLCYDAYNIHSSFHIFVSEILLNLPATFLTISFSVLILFLFLKSLNHKNNRYSALIRPLTVVVGCGVHVVLCITLHYVESYTMQNHQQHLYYQQQQMYRRQQQQSHYLQKQYSSTNLPLHGNMPSTTSSIANSTPPRVLSLICQIIYIFVCFSLGLLYLYLYRMLKRILRSKSQNYIHGLQNLSYAIHITIAIALLFVLLAALQIFGAISISTTRPLVTQPTLEIDWLQWGYQFSLRLIEIAIITLISWVTGLKTSGGNVNIGMVSGDSLDNGTPGGGVFGSGTGVNSREKHAHHHNHHHSNVAGFFLPCTSTSSQEQFDTDYPAVCNANTNLHTYTMRTGKLIYDDNFALNSLTGQSSHIANSGTGLAGEYHQPQPTYHRPYDTGSMQSSSHQSKTDYGMAAGNRYQPTQDMHQYADYMTDATTDHYENPNFDLRTNESAHTNKKYGKTMTNAASTSGLSAPHKQMVLIQNDNCYSEPLSQNGPSSMKYEFKNFDRSHMGNNSGTLENWSERNPPQAPHSRPIEKFGKKSHVILDRSTYENAERRSSNSTHSCTSSMGGRNAGYTSFERGPYNGVRKSGTLNNIDDGTGGPIYGRNSSSSSVTSSNISVTACRPGGAQTLGYADRHHFQHPPQVEQMQTTGGRMGRGVGGVSSGVNGDSVAAGCVAHDMFGRSTLDRNMQQHLYEHPQNSDDDIMLSSSNVERTNLIQITQDGSCSKNGNSKAISDLNPLSSEQTIMSDSKASHLTTNSNSIAFEQNKILMNHSNTNSGLDSASSTISGTSSSVTDSPNSGSMLVAENGFVRFRALDDINNAQGVGIHNASVRKPNRNASVVGANATVPQSS